MSHTPGTWTYDAVNNRVMSDAPTYHGDAVMPVADLSLAYKTSAEMDANGRLLAAAPELLAVCEELARLYESYMTNDASLYPDALVAAVGVQVHDALARMKGLS